MLTDAQDALILKVLAAAIAGVTDTSARALARGVVAPDGRSAAGCLKRLRAAGLVRPTASGGWEITDAGRKAAEEG